jgi:hypothetical protein
MDPPLCGALTAAAVAYFGARLSSAATDTGWCGCGRRTDFRREFLERSAAAPADRGDHPLAAGLDLRSELLSVS